MRRRRLRLWPESPPLYLWESFLLCPDFQRIVARVGVEHRRVQILTVSDHGYEALALHIPVEVASEPEGVIIPWARRYPSKVSSSTLRSLSAGSRQV